MVFSSPTFLFIFLPVVFLLNLPLGKHIKLSNALLTAASLIFYAWGEPVYVLLMIVTTFVAYLMARLMCRYEKRAGLFTALAVIFGIGILVFFKYTDFFITTVNSLTGLSIPLPGIELPIGISFFTFQALSYVLDVKRGDAEASGFFEVLLYISLFPQLIAGPIVRYADVAKQIRSRTVTAENAAFGLRRFAFGLGKKVLIANTLAITADAVYALPQASVTPGVAWLGAICYLFQIYFDFSGYSDMAIGLGRAFGFTFRENFMYPYAANTMQEFWRRWHISLSTWFREYVYIPLGGNRHGKLRTGLNKLTVFLLTGLWHGASWNFAVWGLYHGSFLMLESYGVLKPKKWPTLLGWLYTIVVVTAGFVIFRAEDMRSALMMLSRMFFITGVSANGGAAGYGATVLLSLLSPLTVAALVAAAVGSSSLIHRAGMALEASTRKWTYAVYAVSFLLAAVCALCVSTSSYNPFIYFRF